MEQVVLVKKQIETSRKVLFLEITVFQTKIRANNAQKTPLIEFFNTKCHSKIFIHTPVPSITWTRTVEIGQPTFYLTDFGFSWPQGNTLHWLRDLDSHKLIDDV